jgi:hypothetical protein
MPKAVESFFSDAISYQAFPRYCSAISTTYSFILLFSASCLQDVSPNQMSAFSQEAEERERKGLYQQNLSHNF